MFVKEEDKIKEYAVVDIETTGLNSNIDLIVEIAIVHINFKTGETKPIYNKLVREPGFGVALHEDSWVFQHSDLSFADVNYAAPIEFPKLRQILDKYYMTAYNKSFDIGFLQSRGFKIAHQIQCPMITLTPLCKLPCRHLNTVHKYPSFKEAWEYVFPGREYIQSHRALDDAMHEAELMLELHKQGHIFL